MLFFNNKNTAYQQLNEVILEKNYSSLLLLCDTNTKKYCFDSFLSKSGIQEEQLTVLIIKPGEQEKSIVTTMGLWKSLIDKKIDRNALLINLGGGVISDLGGFAASVYKRGIDYMNIPTTLLAMVDASIGGKTGIDFNGLKNVIGAFKNPELTIIDTDYLNTLDSREKLNGYAEMLKHGLIADKSHWADLTEMTVNEIGYSEIEHSINIKAQIVAEDPNEKGKRKLLNFGHTIGHAIESFFLDDESKSPVKHGEAVAAGMIMESFLSYRLELLEKHKFKNIVNLLINKFGLIKIHPSEFDLILLYLKNDKKNIRDKVLLSLLSDIGKASYDINIDKDSIVSAINYYRILYRTVNLIEKPNNH